MIVVIKDCTKENKSCENKELYLEKYGFHFNKKLCEFALSLMNHPGKTELTWEQVMKMLENNGVNINYDYPYDVYYVANMGYYDYYGSSISDEKHLALYVKDVFTDSDGYEGLPFCRWKADIKAKEIEIDWESMI